METETNPIDLYFQMKEGKIALAQESSEINPAALLSEYVAILRAMHLIHYQSHWTTTGNNFYSNHLLFARLYESAEKRMDSAAEKLIGLYGVSALNLSKQIQMISTIAQEFVSDNQIQNSLGIEKKFIEVAEKIFKFLEDKKELSIGLNDMICAHASLAEENVYLLSQVAKEKSTTD